MKMLPNLLDLGASFELQILLRILYGRAGFELRSLRKSAMTIEKTGFSFLFAAQYVG
jgi:hypothetical protein